MKYLKYILLLLPCLVMAQNELTIEVEGVQSSKGKINIAIYNHAEGFLKFEEVYISDSAVATTGQTWLKISNLPSGEYALAVFHDENGNNILDTNWLGIPKEPVGFSNSRMKTFGPPSFKECSFNLNSDKAIKVIL
ncbi:DUF2141 domain-containing protein [Muriicola soli]|uniref:DUF2141 domain-containing protein n=1 Tax=Muriicola soli TaxID=2507538 RepID=A0A411ECV8_9FLAO|nr:DUF2141 domain-containing protein [Muriicola soli]